MKETCDFKFKSDDCIKLRVIYVQSIFMFYKLTSKTYDKMFLCCKQAAGIGVSA